MGLSDRSAAQKHVWRANILGSRRAMPKYRKYLLAIELARCAGQFYPSRRAYQYSRQLEATPIPSKA